MRSPALIASGFILHNKKNFVRDPLAPGLALSRPYPTPLRPPTKKLVDKVDNVDNDLQVAYPNQ
jgi:hypothetical protein